MNLPLLSWILFLTFENIRGESIIANVTRTVPNNDVIGNKNHTLSSSKATSRNEQNDFVPPKAIRVNAGEGEITDENELTMMPLPQYFYYPNDGLEETFTYQVKKQRRSKNEPLDPQKEMSKLMQQRDNRESFETIQYILDEFDKEVNSKVRNLSEQVNKLSDGMTGNISAVTAAWDQLNQDVVNLTKLSKETSRLVKVLHFSHEQQMTDNKLLAEQVTNLTKEIESLKNERSEDANKFLGALASLQAKLDDSTQEVRLHEAHLRYGQQVMTKVRESVEKNTNRIAGLEADEGPQWARQTVGCGGVVLANSGIISYKFRQPYDNNEKCVWIIRVNRRNKINLQLLEDGFQNQSNSDFLTITEFVQDQHPVTLLTSSRLEHGNNALHTFQGPVIFVTFYSDAANPGTGFTLEFRGVGNRTNSTSVNAIQYRNLHFSAPIGVFTYPSEPDAGTYQPNELVTLAINPPNANSLKIHMKRTDLEKDENCEFDSVSLYGSVTGSYALTKRYCHQGEEFTSEIIQSSDGIFLVIFRSDSSTQFSGFQVSWEIE